MLSALRAWFDALQGERALGVRYEESPPRPKRSAWIVVEGPAATGQLTVWDTGECDIEAETTFEGEVLRRETLQLADAGEVSRVADELLHLVKSHE